MDPVEMARFLNGEGDRSLAMKAAWTLFHASPGFDAPTTGQVLIDLGGPALRPVAFFAFGIVLALGEDGRWAVDESGSWSAAGIVARYDQRREAWVVTAPGSELRVSA